MLRKISEKFFKMSLSNPSSHIVPLLGCLVQKFPTVKRIGCTKPLRLLENDNESGLEQLQLSRKESDSPAPWLFS